MKILFYMNNQDYRYNSFTNILQCLDSQYSIGICDPSIRIDDIVNFNPDVIIHNKPDIKKFPCPGKFISININETDSDTSFSMHNQLGRNYIEPYCVYSSFKKPNKEKYRSKSVYIGNPSVFGECVKELISNDLYGFRFFSETLIPVCGYSGVCTPSESLSIYSGSRACLFQKGDLHRYRDILCSDSNPVEYSGDEAVFLEEILSYINGKSFNKEIREEVISRHTDYDRLAQIFTTIGLNKTADSIKVLKKRKINENNGMS